MSAALDSSTREPVPAQAEARVVDGGFRPGLSEYDALRLANSVALQLEETAVERDRRGGHPAIERQLVKDSGLLGLSVPRAFGGDGSSWSTILKVVRRVAASDSALAHLIGFHHLQVAGLLLYGTPLQQEHFLKLTSAQFEQSALYAQSHHCTAKSSVCHTAPGASRNWRQTPTLTTFPPTLAILSLRHSKTLVFGYKASPMDASHLRVRQLGCWKGELQIVDLAGGITNRNYIVTDGGNQYVVRLGGDIPEHHVMRFNEHAASRAAAAIGLSPEVHYSEADALVIKYIRSSALKPAEVQHHLPAILDLILMCHRELVLQIEGPAMSYWIYHIIRDYLRVLEAKGSKADLGTLRQQAQILEKDGSHYGLVYAHNDLLSANILNDGQRLWLIDWDYAGFNSPLFDLGGLASNNQLSSEQEQWLLENYFQQPLSAELQRDYLAMKAASLLKETLWSMLSEYLSEIDFDYVAYSQMNLARYQRAWQDARNA